MDSSLRRLLPVSSLSAIAFDRSTGSPPYVLITPTNSFGCSLPVHTASSQSQSDHVSNGAPLIFASVTTQRRYQSLACSEASEEDVWRRCLEQH